MMDDQNNKLEWNVFVENINRQCIEKYNIFDHAAFRNDCDAAWKEYKDNFSKFKEAVQRSMMYYFWSKCEWEVIVSGFPPSRKFHDAKIDVYEQVYINWDKFINYLWRYYKYDPPKRVME